MSDQLDEIPVGDEQLPPPDASWKEILEETDWALLREQKNYLNEVIDSLRKSKPIKTQSRKHHQANALLGILELLDCLQDAAANEIGEDKVFDHRCDCGEQLKTFMVPGIGHSLEEKFGCPKCDS